MLILKWTWALVALFNWQYSYKISHLPIAKDHLNVSDNGTLVSCIYPEDRAFKKGSPTFPRSELRSLYEAPGDRPYKFGATVLQYPNGTDYSIWQVFGNGSPLLMLRHRNNQKQMVVFDGSPKIQVVSEFPESCIVDCRGKQVRCGKYVSVGPLKCNKDMYFKLGAYSQVKKVSEKRCVEYGKAEYFTIA